MAYMHKNGFMHRDIKPENFLISSKQLKLPGGSSSSVTSLKLADFGLSGSTANLVYRPRHLRMHPLVTVADSLDTRKVCQDECPGAVGFSGHRWHETEWCIMR